MSLDGGLDELLEFFSSFASRASNSAIRASSTAQFAHRVAATRSSIATPHYPNHLSPTKITLETVNGYNNRNRHYPVVDRRISETFARDSRASTVNKLSDAYVKFFRWASDRLNDRDGIVCFVTNNSFTEQIAFDGMRRHLLRDFTKLYHFDLQGNTRHDPTLSGSAFNVFGIQVGVGITVAIRHHKHSSISLSYASADKLLRREEKLRQLSTLQSIGNARWELLSPDSNCNWFNTAASSTFAGMISIAGKDAKRGQAGSVIFKPYSLGLNSNRDQWVYSFDVSDLKQKIELLVETYNGEIDRWKRSSRPKDIDAFVITDEKRIKWSSRLKETFVREVYASFDDSHIRSAIYRPFTKANLFFDAVLNHRRGVLPEFLPNDSSENDNVLICATGVGAERPFATWACRVIPDLNFFGPGTVPQWFPYFVYDEDGTNRRENITDWALKQFCDHYKDKKITKWDIFHYVYGLLHHPGYRKRPPPPAFWRAVVCWV